MYRVLYKDCFQLFLACQYVLHLPTAVCLLIALIKTIIINFIASKPVARQGNVLMFKTFSVYARNLFSVINSLQCKTVSAAQKIPIFVS